MKASVLRVLASLLAVAWISMGCAIFQPTPPTATKPTASAVAPSQPTSATSGKAELSAASSTVDPEASEAPAPAEKSNRLRAVVDRIVAAVRGDAPAEVAVPTPR